MKQYELKFLGSGGAFHETRGHNSAFLELGTELFLFDVGTDVFYKLVQTKVLQNRTRINIFITHLHCDHVGSLGVLISYLKYSIFEGDISRICVYFPSESIVELLKLQGVDSRWYTHYPNRWDELEVDGMEKLFSYSFQEAFHTEELNYQGKINCFSIECSMADEFSIYYSGDTNSFADCLKNSQQYDYIYHEVCKDIHSNRHLPYKKLLEATKNWSEQEKQKIYLMHLENDFWEEQAKEDGYQVVENILI